MNSSAPLGARAYPQSALNHTQLHGPVARAVVQISQADAERGPPRIGVVRGPSTYDRWRHRLARNALLTGGLQVSAVVCVVGSVALLALAACELWPLALLGVWQVAFGVLGGCAVVATGLQWVVTAPTRTLQRMRAEVLQDQAERLAEYDADARRRTNGQLQRSRMKPEAALAVPRLFEASADRLTVEAERNLLGTIVQFAGAETLTTMSTVFPQMRAAENYGNVLQSVLHADGIRRPDATGPEGLPLLERLAQRYALAQIYMRCGAYERVTLPEHGVHTARVFNGTLLTWASTPHGGICSAWDLDGAQHARQSSFSLPPAYTFRAASHDAATIAIVNPGPVDVAVIRRNTSENAPVALAKGWQRVAAQGFTADGTAMFATTFAPMPAEPGAARQSALFHWDLQDTAPNEAVTPTVLWSKKAESIMAVSPACNRLVSAQVDGGEQAYGDDTINVVLDDLQTSRESHLSAYPLSQSWLKGCFSHDGQCFALLHCRRDTREHTLMVWRISDGGCATPIVCASSHFEGQFQDMQFAPDDRSLLIWGRTVVVMTVDLRETPCVGALRVVWEDHEVPVNTVRFCGQGAKVIMNLGIGCSEPRCTLVIDLRQENADAPPKIIFSQMGAIEAVSDGGTRLITIENERAHLLDFGSVDDA